MVSRIFSGFMGRSLCLLGVVLLPVWEVTEDLGTVLLLPTGGVVVALKGEAGEWLDTGSRANLPSADQRLRNFTKKGSESCCSPADFEGLGAGFTLKGTP